MEYEHFDVAVYCTVGDLANLTMEELAQKFDFLERHLKISKVYLETYRSHRTIDREKMAAIKEFFTKRGIARFRGHHHFGGQAGLGVGARDLGGDIWDRRQGV